MKIFIVQVNLKKSAIKVNQDVFLKYERLKKTDFFPQ